MTHKVKNNFFKQNRLCYIYLPYPYLPYCLYISICKAYTFYYCNALHKEDIVQVLKSLLTFDKSLYLKKKQNVNVL